MGKIRIVLADDHMILRKGLRSLLEAEKRFEIVGEGENGNEVVRLVDELDPDIIVMDISMPNLNGVEATKRVKKHHPDTKVIILSRHKDEEFIFQALNAGADGYLIKESAPSELISAIESVLRGDSYLSPSVSRVVVDDYIKKANHTELVDKFESLTSREVEVLQLLAEGFSVKEISENLHVSKNTVNSHRTHIMEKLDIHSTAKLIQYAIQKGLVERKNDF